MDTKQFPPPSVLKVLQTFRVEVHVSELGSGQLAESLDLEDLRGTSDRSSGRRLL